MEGRVRVTKFGREVMKGTVVRDRIRCEEGAAEAPRRVADGKTEGEGCEGGCEGGEVVDVKPGVGEADEKPPGRAPRGK